MKRILFTLIALWFAPTVQAATITVCATGCTYNNSQLQTALNAAASGDTVLLESGQTYASGTDGFVLGAQCHIDQVWDCITVRTGVTSSGSVIALSNFPAAGVRMDTTYRTNSTGKAALAKIIPSVNNSPAIRTIWPGETGSTCSSSPCVGDGWTLQFLEIYEKVDYAQGSLVTYGTNKVGKEWNGSCTYPDATPSCWSTAMPGGDTQDMLVEIPGHLTLIQCDLHGDPFVGQQNGVLLATKDARVLNNSMTDLKSRRENQAVIGINGIGPYDVENNLLQATTENVMWGGSDTYLQLKAVITGSPTTTTIQLGSPVWMHPELTTTPANLATDIYNNIFITVTHAGTTYAGIKCAISGSTCTLSPALAVTPSAGDVVRWNWVHGGVTLKYNWLDKPLSWKGAAISKPTGLNLVAGTGGSLSAGSHCYQVIQWALLSGELDAYSDLSTEACVVTAASGKVTATWTGDSHATHYWIYGNGTTGTESKFWNVTSATYVDTGAGGTAGGVGFEGQGWLVKNAGEMKGCDGASPMGACIWEGNVIGANWCCTQNATVTFKVHNQDLNDISQVLRNFTVRNNWIRHGNRAMALVTSSTGNSSGPQASGVMTDVTITNNLFTDSDTVYEYPHAGGTLSNSTIVITVGEWPNIPGGRGCIRCTITHNSFFVNSNNMNGPLQFVFNASTDLMTDFVLRDNIMGRDCTDAGCVGAGNASLKLYNPSNVGLGTTAWNAAVTGSSFADHNEWPDGGAGTYTAGPFTTPFFVADATVKSTHLTNYTNCNTDVDILGCALVGGSSMHNAASDRTDVGANVATIKTFSDIALSGNPAGGTPPPSIVPGVPRWRIRIRGSAQ